MRTLADYEYWRLITDTINDGEKLTTRNHEVFRQCVPRPSIFHSFPLVTLKKTAVKKALREMEWFLSGDNKCPDELKDWWDGQLDPEGHYWNGYADQLRSSTYWDGGTTKSETFDQIEYLIDGVKNSPNSRRLCISTWNTGEMATIAKTNKNPNTPSACHLSFVQFFVSGNRLNMWQYQRSGDLLLGVCHNFVQHYSLLTYLAHKTGLKVGWYQWQGGDVHVYNEPSHIECAEAIINMKGESFNAVPRLVYTPTSENFLAKDFSVEWDGADIPEPVTMIRPKLL
jgi:thymidylate synthase